MLDEEMRRNEKIKELIERAIDEPDEAERNILADEMLSLDPNDPVGRFIKWESLDAEESIENIGALESAYDTLRARTDALSDDAEEYELYQGLLVAMLSNLASCKYFNDDKESALEFAEEFMNLDDEGHIAGRVIYYALLIEMKKYEEAIEAADIDICETPMSEHARAIAIFESQGPGHDASVALLEAIMLDPDIPFLILGLSELDEDETGEDLEEGEADDLMMQVAILTDLWGTSEERLAFLSAIVFAFGYLTDRIGRQDDLSMLENGYKSLGCLDEMIAGKQAIAGMIEDGRDLGETDEEALSLLQEMIEQGVFG